MSSVKLSIIMPCYNCENTVTEAVESIYAQNMTFPFEVIMLDDGSTDETWGLLTAFDKQYDEVKVFSMIVLRYLWPLYEKNILLLLGFIFEKAIETMTLTLKHR